MIGFSIPLLRTYQVFWSTIICGIQVCFIVTVIINKISRRYAVANLINLLLSKRSLISLKLARIRAGTCFPLY